MGHTMIAPVGEHTDALFVGMKEFSIDRVVLLMPEGEEEHEETARSDLEKYKIPVDTHELNGDIWESMFEAVGSIKERVDQDDIIINASTGGGVTNCVAISAAFVNGLKCIAVKDDTPITLPILKFSYFKALTERKMELLELIYDDYDCCSSLEQLSQKSGLSMPLISYHINGNLKSDGLIDLGLVETDKEGGSTSVSLTTLGRLLVKGQVPEDDE